MLDERLSQLQQRKDIAFLDKADGRSVYKAASDNGRLLSLLGIQPTLVADAVPEIGLRMKAVVSDSIRTSFDNKDLLWDHH